MAGREQKFVTLNIKTVSEANRRDHWAVRAKRVKEQRAATLAHLRKEISDRELRKMRKRLVIVELIRCGGRKLDSDNLIGSMKAVRDAVADFFGIDDGDDSIGWSYAQETYRKVGVEVVFFLEAE